MRDWNSGFTGTKVSYGLNLDASGRVVRGEWVAQYVDGELRGEPEFRPSVVVDDDGTGYDDYQRSRRIMGISAGLAVACAVIVIAVSLYAGLVV